MEQIENSMQTLMETFEDWNLFSKKGFVTCEAFTKSRIFKAEKNSLHDAIHSVLSEYLESLPNSNWDSFHLKLHEFATSLFSQRGEVVVLKENDNFYLRSQKYRFYDDYEKQKHWGDIASIYYVSERREYHVCCGTNGYSSEKLEDFSKHYLCLERFDSYDQLSPWEEMYIFSMKTEDECLDFLRKLNEEV